MCELVARLDLVELRLASPCSAGLHAGEWSNGPAMRLAAPMATQYKRGGGVVPGGGRARARVGLKCSPFIGCSAEPLVRCTHAEGGAGSGACWPCGSGGRYGRPRWACVGQGESEPNDSGSQARARAQKFIFIISEYFTVQTQFRKF